jgi:hypothetical protein
MKKTPCYILAGIGLLSQARAGELMQLSCPEIVRAESMQVVPPEGWAAQASGDFRLSSAGFNNGPPEKRADLKPWSVSVKGRKSVETWRFEADEFSNDGLWLVCGYGGAAGQVTLAKQMLSAYSACSITYSPSSKAGARSVAIACR